MRSRSGVCCSPQGFSNINFGGSFFVAKSGGRRRHHDACDRAEPPSPPGDTRHTAIVQVLETRAHRRPVS